MSREDDPPDVGYKKPPQHSRFQKGRSGNPSGRRKAAPEQVQLDCREIVLSQLVPMTIGGKRVKVTAREALYQKLLAMSLAGNLRAAALLLKNDGLNDNKPDTDRPLTEAEEEALIERFFARKRSAETGGGDE
ncbi:MAG: DUF5681 domain-containing protein [Bosea sp. (in: a-proteobacteria)]|uniref:DUF5681 domain-containing protein n=1 Tax=Bosea sp. (in: a-proteobacteria) TaxID=1871050 RepID=UPI003F7C48EF